MQSLDLEFTVTTTPNAFELDPKSSGLVNKFVVYDSILPERMGDIDVSFYPTAEFVHTIRQSIGDRFKTAVFLGFLE